jgi:C-terminal peptidase prc
MRRPLPVSLLPALGLLIAPLLAPAALAQEGLDARVAGLLQRAEGIELDRIWEVSHEISGLDAQDDALARALTSSAGKAGDRGRLVAGRALIDLSDGTSLGKDILATLQPVAASNDEAARAAAMGLLGTRGVFTRNVLTEAQDLLEKNTTSELAPPRVRIEAAKSLWTIGTDKQRSAARETLTKFLASTDRNLKIQGALALAEINTDSSGPGWEVLREIQDEPTPEGRLARSYLRFDAELRRAEHMLQRNLANAKPGEPDPRGYQKLEEVIARIQAQHIQGDKIDRDFLIDNACRGMLHALDRHSSYFTSDEFKRFFFDLNREYGGIGAFVNFDRDDVFSIIRPIYSGPAYRAGLRSGDKLLEVDGWETAGHTSEEIIARLKGHPGTPVTVKMFRPGMEKPEDVVITREEIQVPSVNAEVLPGNIGYVELLTFGANTADELRAALTGLRDRGVEGLILDVRNNTGGYLVAAADVVDTLVAGRKRVVYTKSRNGVEEEYSTHDRAVMPDTPMVVLVNGYSASASEIVAGALQDLGRAVVVGTRSFGKGSVQSLIPVQSEPGEPFVDENGNGMRDDWEKYDDTNGNDEYDVGPRIKLTMARYYLPSGRTPNKEFDAEGKIVDPDWGIVPDQEVEMREFTPEDAWKTEPLRDLLKRNVFRDYVKAHIDAHKELLTQLAEGDGGDWTRYPDFEEFYTSLDTKLPRDDIRRWVRFAVRDAVADLRGQAFAGTQALGDPQEDVQLQEALRTLFGKLGRDIRDIAEYRDVLRTAQAPQPEDKSAHQVPR